MAGAEANGPEQRRKTNGTREWKLQCDSKFQQRSCQSNRHGHSPRTALTRAPATATECIYSTILVVCRSICCMDCDSVRSGVRGHCHCRSLSRARSSAPARTVPVDTGDWTGRIYMEARDRHGVRNISEAGTLDLFLSFPCA